MSENLQSLLLEMASSFCELAKANHVFCYKAYKIYKKHQRFQCSSLRCVYDEWSLVTLQCATS